MELQKLIEESFPNRNEAERKVVQWENKIISTTELLIKCNLKTARRIVESNDIEFIDQVRAFVRAVEAACYTLRNSRHADRVKAARAYGFAKILIPAIKRRKNDF